MLKLYVYSILLLIILSSIPRQAEAAPNCSVPRINTLNDKTVNGTMSVKAGARCSIVMSSRGPTFGASVVKQPSHGVAHVRGHSVIYQPHKGYTGNDAFTYARQGLDTQNNKVTRTVNIAVDVTP